GLEHQMEGKHRPGHFDGVGTIVKKLFEIVEPTHAYFGEKDFQQLQIVKKLVLKNKIPVNIIPCEIYRESSGLAMSSRNERLSKKARNESKLIYKILLEAKDKFMLKSAKEVGDFVMREFKKHKNFTLEYFEIAEEETLLTCKRKIKNKKYRGFIAVFIEDIRLIDNISLK
ncbi:pantoate--beta-alanine ligase, partial [Flavobacterium sp.]|uniref:pantoate--beta-alanine ligase n=1 Tax=Flavobacterium sp. TaxID=239 RepID=UPI003340C7FC